MEAKDYEELSFTDDFMFGKVLQTHPDICRELIELILFENRCREDNNIILGDEAQKVFLNAAGTIDDVSEEMKNFLEFLKTGKGNKGLPEDITEAVKKVKSSGEWRTEYMTLLMRDKENIEKGKMQMLFSMVQDGELSIEKAAGKVNIPVPDFEKQMEEAGYKRYQNPSVH